jgi:hypothetical protein
MIVAAIDPKSWSYLPVLLLTLAIAIGVPMAYRLWRDTHEEEDLPRGTDLLSDFERAYYAGQMDEAEFHRIRDLLIGSKGKGSTKIRTKPPRADETGLSPLPAPEQPMTAQGDDPPSSPEVV